MKLIAADTRITGFIQVGYKCIHQVEKAVFMGIIMLTVEPVNHIASEQSVMGNLLLIAGTSGLKLVPGKKAYEVMLQVCGKGAA